MSTKDTKAHRSSGSTLVCQLMGPGFDARSVTEIQIQTVGIDIGILIVQIGLRRSLLAWAYNDGRGGDGGSF